MKVLKMPIIGLPNVGKSSLLNALIGKKVSIVTHKPHTTRSLNKISKGLNQAEIAFVDTPGIQKLNTKLGKIIFKNMQSYLQSLDNMMLVVDAVNLQLEMFLPYIEKSIIIINKIDFLKKHKLLAIIQKISEYNPKKIFCVCAKTGDGVQDIVEYLQKEEHFFDFENENDIPEFNKQEILEYACECVREKFLIKFEQEVPYNVFVRPVYSAIFKESAWKIFLDIIVPKESYKPIILGKKAQNLKQIGKIVRLELSTKIKQPGYLGLNIIVDDKLWKKEETYNSLGWKVDI